jgi:hypothetical protein
VQVFSAIANAGVFPRASVLTPSQRLFVQGSLSRNVLVYDVSRLLEEFDQSSSPLIADIPTVANEKMDEQVLLGKRIFHNAEDTRMAFEGYLTCGGCHFEGIDDGRVYDFSSRGEGFRNTLSLIGTGQGRLNWTGNLDEVQDFEHQIRDLFDGLGFMTDDALHTGTRDQPLGEAKAGLSPELDALDAYVSSLEHANPSPYRNQDGSLTADGVAGRVFFEKLGCDFCHSGEKFTDSERGMLHDVGTIGAQSGTRAGEPLLGFDTPTLRGVWETPPYLHDGSAPTLKDVVTTKNPTGLHGFTSVLSPTELDQLVSYLLQIDDELPIRRLPFEPPAPPATTPEPETSPGANAGGTSALDPPVAEAPKHGVGESGCNVSSRSSSALVLVLPLLISLGRRRFRRGHLAGGAP